MFNYIEAPSIVGIVDEDFWDNSIFLGGSITGAVNWQRIAIDKLQYHYHIFNPRRENFDVTKKEESVIQIKWEHLNIKRVKNLMFWFSPETFAPITLFELGAALERKNQNLFVGCHPDYQRKFDVEIQAALQGLTRIYDNLQEMLDEIIKVKGTI